MKFYPYKKKAGGGGGAGAEQVLAMLKGDTTNCGVVLTQGPEV